MEWCKIFIIFIDSLVFHEDTEIFLFRYAFEILKTITSHMDWLWKNI